MSFYIKTRAGNKGPFNSEQLRRLVEEEKLPESHPVLDAEGVQHRVSSILNPPELQDEIVVEPQHDDEVQPVAPRPARAGGPRRSGRPVSGQSPQKHRVLMEDTSYTPIERISWISAVFRTRSGWFLVLGPVFALAMLIASLSEDDPMRVTGRHRAKAMVFTAIARMLGPGGVTVAGLVGLPLCLLIFYRLNKERCAT